MATLIEDTMNVHTFIPTLFKNYFHPYVIHIKRVWSILFWRVDHPLGWMKSPFKRLDMNIHSLLNKGGQSLFKGEWKGGKGECVDSSNML